MGANDKTTFARLPAKGSLYEFLCEAFFILTRDRCPSLWDSAPTSNEIAELAPRVHPGVIAWHERWASYLERQDRRRAELATSYLEGAGAPADWLSSAGGLQIVARVARWVQLELFVADQVSEGRGVEKRLAAGSMQRPGREDAYPKTVVQDVIFAAYTHLSGPGPKALANWLNEGSPGDGISADHVARALKARQQRIHRSVAARSRTGRYSNDACLAPFVQSDLALLRQFTLMLRARERAPAFGIRGLKGAALARAIHNRSDIRAGVRRLEDRHAAMMSAA